MKLQRRFVDKPWGRRVLPPPFEECRGSNIGEIIFVAQKSRAEPLLIKFIITDDKLSVQVHPTDRLARARGLPHGKSECWYILQARREARIALGFKDQVDAETARSSALDGSIEELLQWLPVAPGDFFHVPAGTVHAIGAGITLLEVQQNLDVTYRLYDYGRPRKLHLLEAIEAATLEPYHHHPVGHTYGEASTVLVSNEHFSMVRMKGSSSLLQEIVKHDRWVVPLQGTIFSSGERATLGECMFLRRGAPLSQSEDGLMLVAIEGPIS